MSAPLSNDLRERVVAAVLDPFRYQYKRSAGSNALEWSTNVGRPGAVQSYVPDACSGALWTSWKSGECTK